MKRSSLSIKHDRLQPPVIEWVPRHLLENHLTNRHLAERHLADKHLADKHLAERPLADNHLSSRHLGDTAMTDLARKLLHSVDKMSVGQVVFDKKTFHRLSDDEDKSNLITQTQ